MKKQLVILGIAVLLICVGLSGCFEQKTDEGNKILSVSHVVEYCENYINQTITVRGRYIFYLNISDMVVDSSENQHTYNESGQEITLLTALHITISENTNRSILIEWEEIYDFTGILKTCGNLEVSKVEPV